MRPAGIFTFYILSNFRVFLLLHYSSISFPDQLKIYFVTITAKKEKMAPGLLQK